jgi:hypothetical protein
MAAIAGAIIIGCIIGYDRQVASNSPLFNASVLVDFLKAKMQGRNAFPGKDGWLYYRCDLAATLEPWLHMRRNVETIAALNDSLSRKGIKLIILSVPFKSAIMQTYSPFRVDNVSNQRTRMIEMLKKRNIDVIDLAPVFMADTQKELLFQKKDTHWDGRGLSFAARIVTDSVISILGKDTGEPRYIFKDTTICESRDLAKFSGDTSLYPKSCRMILANDGEPFKDSVWSDIMVFGDSFSWVNHAFSGGLGAQIAWLTNRPTFTIFHICATKEPVELLTFLKNRRKMPKIVIWVFVSNVLCGAFDALQ